MQILFAHKKLQTFLSKEVTSFSKLFMPLSPVSFSSGLEIDRQIVYQIIPGSFHFFPLYDWLNCKGKMPMSVFIYSFSYL